MNELITQIDAGMGYTGDVMASTLAYPEDWFFEAVSWGRSETGETVNPRTALSHGPVWQAVNIIAGDIGQLPLNIFKKVDRKHVLQESHPVEWLLAHEPNPYQTPAIWKETMMAWALLWGNGCSYIARDAGGRPQMLIPLSPEVTRPVLIEIEDDDTGEKVREWWIETDFGDGIRKPLPYWDVFHVRGLATDGFWGLSAVQVCKNVIGSGLAQRKHGNSVFQNGGRPGGALEIPGAQPPPEVMQKKRAELEAIHGGAKNAGKWMLLYNGTKFSPYSMNNVDAQWLESMDLDREFIAGIFGLPPYKLGAMKNAAVRANVEQQALEYVNGTLTRPLNKIREEIHRKLFTPPERRRMQLYAEWDLADLLRGDMASTMAFLAAGVTAEILTQNEARVDYLGLDALPGGDKPRNPAINPVVPAKETAPKKTDDPSPAPPDNSAAKRSARSLVAHQVDALIEAEVKAVERACNPENAVNLVRWAESYYESYQKAAGHFLDLHCDLASSTGCGPCDWRRVACDHARDSLNRLLSMAGIVTRDSLPQIGKDFAESVRERKTQFANAILGE